MGGDELASSDVGQGLRQTQQVYRVGKFAATAGVHGVALTGKATHKAAKMIAPEAVYECPGHEHTDNDGSYTEYCDSELGCEGHWECEGHDHWGCPDGHHTSVCYGHVDLTMSVNIASLNRIYDMGGVEVKGEKALPESSEAQEGGSN